MSPSRITILSDAQIDAACDWADAVDASDEAYRTYARGTAISPNRTRIALEHGRRFALMPGADLSRDALGVKLVGYYPDNPERDLPRVTGVYMLLDPVTGQPRALLEGARLTNLRTAAGAVVAARTLARPGWTRLGIIGSGGLARASAQAFLACAAPGSVTLYSRTQANLLQFAAEVFRTVEGRHEPPSVEVATDPEQVVEAADVIVCATDTRDPVFDGRALGPGRLVISLGANTPTTRELDATTMSAGRVFVDSRSAVLAECGEVILARAEGVLPAEPELVELGAVLSGERPGRLADDETLVFLSTGLSLQDLLTAQRIVARAAATGAGTVAPLFE